MSRSLAIALALGFTWAGLPLMARSPGDGTNGRSVHAAANPGTTHFAASPRAKVITFGKGEVPSVPDAATKAEPQSAGKSWLSLLKTNPIDHNVRAPDLKGTGVSEAFGRLRAVGLRGSYGVYYVPADRWRKEFVAGRAHIQSPSPGAQVEAGGIVAFWTLVPSGPSQRRVTVPDLTGDSMVAASKKLSAAGLVPMPLRNVPGSPLSEDHEMVVRAQYPRPGQEVGSGTTVFVTWKYK